jgi:NTE family protein/lysophospholipid hydrolase
MNPGEDNATDADPSRPAGDRRDRALSARAFWQQRLRETLPSLLGPLEAQVLDEIEREADWIEVRSGDFVAREDDRSNDFVILLGGCLEVLGHPVPGGSVAAAGLVHVGDCLGDLALFTEEPWGARVRAVRDSVLARFDVAALAALCHRHPTLMQRLGRLACQRLQSHSARPARIPRHVGGILVVPLHHSAGDFAASLQRALAGDALHLTRSRIEALFPARFDTQDEGGPSDVRMSTWLDRQELTHVAVVYEADPAPSAWTAQCIERAERLLFVAGAEEDPRPGELEQYVRERAAILPRPPRVSLVLIHPGDRERPVGTSRWLRDRPWHDVYHVRANSQADQHRVGRVLSGRAIGLALGGGGARGLAHVGVIRALEDAGIPIDVVGGTSVGAVVAAQHALGMRWEAMRDAFVAFARMKPQRDYTLPITGLIRGRTFERAMQRMFQDVCLEDLWVRCFGISADLSSAQMIVHERGLVRRMVRASCALPGIAVPAVEDGHVLVDGGVVNSLPGDVMRGRCGTVIAVDVSPTRPVTTGGAVERLPSASQVLRSRLNPLRRSIPVPTIVEILEQATALGSLERKLRVAADADLYLCPPVGHVPTLDVRSFDEILETGYAYARARIGTWRPMCVEC